MITMQEKPKLYEPTKGVSYHIFHVEGGGVVVEVCDFGDISHFCCAEADWRDTLELVREGKHGQVVEHLGPHSIMGIKPVD